MEDQKDLFISFCNSRYGTSAEGDQSAACGRSKTITKAKGQKIINVLKSNPVALEYSPKFRHWVKQKGFKLMSHHALGLKEVLCLPANKKVCYVYNYMILIQSLHNCRMKMIPLYYPLGDEWHLWKISLTSCKKFIAKRKVTLERKRQWLRYFQH